MSSIINRTGEWAIILLALLVSGCGPNPSSDTTPAAAIQLPDEIVQLRLQDNGAVHAYVQVDGGTRSEMTISGSSATLSLTLTEGSHSVKIILEYVLTSDPSNPVTLAESTTKSVTVTASSSTPLNYTDSDFDFTAYDDDSDGISNLSEMQSGTTAPEVTATTPADGATDIAATTTIDITFDDPMILSTLQSSFTLSGNNVGAVTGTVTLNTTTNTASFTPSQVLRAYEVYTASVSTGAQNTAGLALAATESWSFTIQEPPVQQISSVQTSGATTTPILEYNAAGEGMAVWEVSNIGRSLVYSFYDGTDWSSEAVLDSISNNASMNPQLVSNGSGFALVWTAYDGTAYQLMASFYDGSSWSTAAAIDTQDASVYEPKLATNGTGYAVTWYQQENSSSQSRIYARICADPSISSTWGAAVVIDNSSSNAYSPRIASNGNDYAVIWIQDSPQRLGVNVYTGSWSFGTAALLDTATIYSAGGHQIVSNGDGYSVIWYKYDGARYNVYNRTYYNSSGYSWSARTDIDGSTNSAYMGAENSISSNGTGYAVTFRRYNGTVYDVFAVINAAGDNTWGTAAALESAAGSVSGSPIISSNGSGYASLWSQYDGSSTYDLFSSVYNGTSWSGGAAIEAGSTPIYSGYFKLDSIGSKYVASWIQQVSSLNHIYANVYDNGWSPTVEQLDSATSSTSIPEIELNPNVNEIVVTWSETGAGVFTNVYDDSSWSTQTALTTTAFGGSSYSPRLTSNGNGRTLAIWRQYSGSNYNLYANIHENGSWGTAPEVLTTGSVSSSYMDAATDGDGFVVVWLEYDGTYNSIYASVFDGSGWSTKQEVDDSSINGSAYLFSNASGEEKSLVSNGTDYMLVYRQYDGSDYDNIYAVQFDGSSWGSPQVLDDASINQSAYSPIIETNGTEYLAMWNQYDGTAHRVYSNEFDGSNWGTAQLLENSGNSFYGYPRRLTTNGTDYLAVWSQKDGTQYRSYASFYTTGGSWSPTSALDSGTAGHQVYSYPAAVHSSGNQYAAAWQEYNGSAYEIMVTTYDGTTWVAPTSLDDGAAGNGVLDSYYYNVLSSNGSGYALVWRRYNGTAYDAYASLFDGTDWSVAAALETGAESVNNIQIASNGDGYLAAWQQDDGTGLFDIVSNRYNPATPGWGGESLLDEDDSNSAFELNLKGTADGYLGAWTQPEPTGDPAVRFPWAKILF